MITYAQYQVICRDFEEIIGDGATTTRTHGPEITEENSPKASPRLEEHLGILVHFDSSIIANAFNACFSY